MTIDEVPKKYYDLVSLALIDLKKCEDDPKFLINMKNWLVQFENICSVCFGGAILAQSLNLTMNDVELIFAKDLPIANRLRGLDALRCASYSFFFEVYSGHPEPLDMYRQFVTLAKANGGYLSNYFKTTTKIGKTSYEADKEGFYKRMNETAEILKKLDI